MPKETQLLTPSLPIEISTSVPFPPSLPPSLPPSFLPSFLSSFCFPPWKFLAWVLEHIKVHGELLSSWKILRLWDVLCVCVSVEKILLICWQLLTGISVTKDSCPLSLLSPQAPTLPSQVWFLCYVLSENFTPPFRAYIDKFFCKGTDSKYFRLVEYIM